MSVVCQQTLLKHGLKYPENGYHGDERAKKKRGGGSILTRKIPGATDLKLDMHIQLHPGSNMGWVPLATPLSFPV